MARAALKIDLNENWTITPQIMGQKQKSYGSFAEERGLGDLETMQFQKEKFTDDWWQAALTVEGKIGNFDVTYAGAYMRGKSTASPTTATIATSTTPSLATAPTGTTTTIIRSTRPNISSRTTASRRCRTNCALRLPPTSACAWSAGLFYQRQRPISSSTTSSMGSPIS